MAPLNAVPSAAVPVADRLAHGGAEAAREAIVVLSGGNIDAGLLAALARHRETAEGRRMRQTGVELILETRGSAHSRAISAALRAAGYEVESRT